jgi:hypothetical protein
MYVDPELTVSTFLGWVRDATIIFGVVAIGWKSRGIVEDVKGFATLVRTHMLKMEVFTHRVETNHMKHIETYLYKIAKDRNLITILPPDSVEADDVPPPEDLDAIS